MESFSGALRRAVAKESLDRLARYDPAQLADGAVAFAIRMTDVVDQSETVGVAGASRIARRIGPVYAIDEVARWIDGGPLSPEAIRQRVVRHDLVGFRTDDHKWALPAWQFRAVAGRLVDLADVTALWSQLPHDSWMTDVDLAAWMSTRLRSLDDVSPAQRAASHGYDDPLLRTSVSRLVARVR